MQPSAQKAPPGSGGAAGAIRPDFTRASSCVGGSEIEKTIDDAFAYHPWTKEQEAKGTEVRHALALAVKVIVQNVPPSPDRSAAIRKIREARMDANSAITHGGKY
jgi:hypothetical protein